MGHESVEKKLSASRNGGQITPYLRDSRLVKSEGEVCGVFWLPLFDLGHCDKGGAVTGRSAALRNFTELRIEQISCVL